MLCFEWQELSVSFVCAQVLFDSGSTYFFISRHFVESLEQRIELLDFDLSISTPLSSGSIANLIIKAGPLLFGSQEFLVDVILLEMQGFDIILGMD